MSFQTCIVAAWCCWARIDAVQVGAGGSDDMMPQINMSDPNQDRSSTAIIEKITNPDHVGLRDSDADSTSFSFAFERTLTMMSDQDPGRCILAIIEKMTPDQIVSRNSAGMSPLEIALLSARIQSDEVRERVTMAIIEKMTPDQMVTRKSAGMSPLEIAVASRAIKSDEVREHVIMAMIEKMTPDQMGSRNRIGMSPLESALTSPAIKSNLMRERIIEAIIAKLTPDQMRMKNSMGHTLLMAGLKYNGAMSLEFRERVVQLLLQKTEPDDLQIEDDLGRKALKEGDWRLKWSEFIKQAKVVIQKEGKESELEQKPLCMEGDDGLPALLKQILPDVIDEDKWRLMMLRDAQQLRIGFVKLSILGCDGSHLRLHIFDPKLFEEDVEGIHSHKWPFQSYVLYGKLNSEIWKLDEHCTESEKQDNKAEEKFEFVKEVGANLQRQARLNRTEPVPLRQVGKQEHSSGQSYFFPTGDIHKALPVETQTATLMLSHPTSADAKEYKANPKQEYGDALTQDQAIEAENEAVQEDIFNELLDGLSQNLNPHP